MNNVLIGVDESGSFRVYLTITTDMVETARKIHDTTPLATAALGRVLTGAGLMGLMLKNDGDKVTVQFKGDGPAREILVAANGSGEVKGYISNPDVELPKRSDGKLDVGGALGIGTLTVIKDLGLKEPYVGRIDLVSGEIAEDLTAYFFVSEQQSASVALGVRMDTDASVAAAGGLIIQMLPDGKLEAVEALEAMLGELQSITLLVKQVQEREGRGHNPQQKHDQDQSPEHHQNQNSEHNQNQNPEYDRNQSPDQSPEHDQNQSPEQDQSPEHDQSSEHNQNQNPDQSPEHDQNQSPEPDRCENEGAPEPMEAMLQDLLDTIFSGMPAEFQVKALAFRRLAWNCDCSRERMGKALISIGEKDLRSIYEEDGQAELVCQFCRERYEFDQSQLGALLAEVKE